jgi:hypothetical protein
VAIPYPISNQEFYNGTGVDKSKSDLILKLKFQNIINHLK